MVIHDDCVALFIVFTAEEAEENVVVMDRSPRRIIKKTAKALAMQPVSPSTSVTSDHSTSGRRTRRTESPVCSSSISTNGGGSGDSSSSSSSCGSGSW